MSLPVAPQCTPHRWRGMGGGWGGGGAAVAAERAARDGPRSARLGTAMTQWGRAHAVLGGHSVGPVDLLSGGVPATLRPPPPPSPPKEVCGEAPRHAQRSAHGTWAHRRSQTRGRGTGGGNTHRAQTCGRHVGCRRAAWGGDCQAATGTMETPSPGLFSKGGGV